MGVVNYFRDHLRDHSAVAKLLYEMVALVTKHKTKALSWTTEGYVAFERLTLVKNSEVILHRLPTSYYPVHRRFRLRARRILMSNT